MFSETAIEALHLGKMYKLYRRPADKVIDAFGLGKLFFWRRNTYKPFWALRDLNIKIRKGERLGIIGRNGAGKSTFLKVITGNVTPTEGRVSVHGRIQALMELGTGFHPEFTGRENIRASLGYQGLTQSRIRTLEEEIVDFAEIDEFIDQPIKTYSAGMYARLAFSTATAIEPEVLIIDEVLGAGDAYFAGKCVERMRRLTDQSGATVLFVSHDLASVQALCDRVLWLERGMVKADGEPLSIIKQYVSVVRQEEEARLKARDLKVSKNQAVVLDSMSDIFETMLCRLITLSGDHPKGRHRIRNLILRDDKAAEIGRIDIGAPMDNSAELQHYVMDEPSYMNWGPSESDSKGYFRCFADYAGRYRHAPFEFAVPRSFLRPNGRLVLEVCADIADNDVVSVEVFSPALNDYKQLGTLASGHNETDFNIDTGVLTKHTTAERDAVPVDGLTPIDQYGSGGARISSVHISDSSGTESKSLRAMEPFSVTLDYETTESISNPCFVFCIYTALGMTATQWVVSAEQLGHTALTGKGSVVFRCESLLIGRGSYVASAAIFKWFPTNGVEPESYHVLDRCIHFQIVERDPTDILDYGICRQPVSIEIIPLRRGV